jgi:GNAT superfamily N-acetyltransferase
MPKYTNKQLHEAYTIEYHAHKQTQEALKRETQAHASTRRSLMESLDKLKELEFQYLVQAAIRFLIEANLPIAPNIEHYYRHILSLDNVFSHIIPNKGIIVGILSPSFLEPQHYLASELVWFVEPEHRNGTTGIKLLKEFERIAKERGATRVQMVCLEKMTPEVVGKIYTKLGYNLVEHHYLKEI